MNEHHYQRIDKGTKRDYRALARRQPRTNKGTFGLIHDPEKRHAAILDALNSLPSGETTDAIAKRHNIPGSTLRAWIISDSSIDAQANYARIVFLSHELSKRAEEIDTAQDPLALARAREGFRAWSWIAERREARMYGQKQEVTHIVADLGDRLRRARERVIEHEAAMPDGRITGVMSHSTPNEIKELAAVPEVSIPSEPRDPNDPKEGG